MSENDKPNPSMDPHNMKKGSSPELEAQKQTDPGASGGTGRRVAGDGPASGQSLGGVKRPGDSHKEGDTESSSSDQGDSQK